MRTATASTCSPRSARSRRRLTRSHSACSTTTRATASSAAPPAGTPEARTSEMMAAVGPPAAPRVARVDAVSDALSFAFGMTWEVLWALILGLRAVRRGAGGRQQAGDAPAATGRLCRGRSPSPRASAPPPRRARTPPSRSPGRCFAEGAELHRGDGLPVRLDQPCSGAGRHPGRPDRLAVHRQRIRRRSRHDRPDGAALPAFPDAAARRRRPAITPSAACSGGWRATPRWT